MTNRFGDGGRSRGMLGTGTAGGRETSMKGCQSGRERSSRASGSIRRKQGRYEGVSLPRGIRQDKGECENVEEVMLATKTSVHRSRAI